MNARRASRTTRRLSVALLALLAVTVAVAHTTVTAARPGERPSPTAAAPPAALATRPVPPTSPDVATRGTARDGRHWRAVAREHLGVLRQPRSVTGDTVAPAVAAQPTVTAGGVDLSAARRVEASDGEAAWIAPSSDGSAVCAVRAGAVACPAASLLEITGVSPGLIGRTGEPYHVWGIAGDDVSSLVLTEGDGTRVAVTVTDNFFDVETDEWPRTLTWTGPGGAESFTFPSAS